MTLCSNVADFGNPGPLLLNATFRTFWPAESFNQVLQSGLQEMPWRAAMLLLLD